jgi:hypothetical protein
MYNVIANANTILSAIDEAKKKNIFDNGIYELIKGEALAVRAFCYFDILRLFGPIPGGDTKMNMPYDKKLTHKIKQGVSYEQFLEFILADLDEAEKLLEKTDPIKTGEFVEKTSFKTNRKFRMNYYTVLGLKARVYLWKQDKDKAYEYAKKIIDSNKFKLGNTTDILIQHDYTFSSEHLTALPVWNAETNFNGFFRDEKDSQKSGKLYVDKNIIDTKVYSAGDARKKLWKLAKLENEDVYALLKYEHQKAIPLMRLSEMYLILTECAETLNESNNWYLKFAKTRGFHNTTLNESNKLKEIIKEYKKEFYAEGQLFYTYKRLNTDLKDVIGIRITYNNNPYYNITNKQAYVIPLPEKEIMVGYKNPVTE